MDDLGAKAASAFLRYDRDRDGYIDRFEFQGLIEELVPERAKDASVAFDEIDKDDDKRLTFDEFMAWWQQ